MYKKQCFGQSKHDAKADAHGRAVEGIYSYNTMDKYIKVCTQFAEWCKQEYGCKTINECRQYSQAYIDSRQNLSASTLKLDVSALNKLYGENVCHSEKSRLRSQITRSRTYTDRSIKAEKQNPDITEFCRATGLRRKELVAVRSCDIKTGKDGKLYVQVQQGKGGKFRSLEVLEDKKGFVLRYQSDSKERIFDNVPGNLDVHMYRSEYARALYNQYYNESDKKLEERNLYYCRGDKKGVVYDRDVMLKVSQNLGHNRVSVIAGHYL